MQEDITMSAKEANQVEVFTLLKNKQIKQKKASQILGITTRQIRRKLARFKQNGITGLIHANRGRTSNNKVDEAEITAAIKVLKEKYHDFHPTFAHEKLTKYHNVTFSVERLRQAMIAEDIWKPKRRKSVRNHQMRKRRECEGELIQIDGSPHDWFEGRGSVGMCTLLVYIDDATGKLLHLEFVESESTWSYFKATKRYFENHGKPLAFYNDKHGVFRVNSTKAGAASTSDSVGLTQFGRAMKELEVELIYAHSPQAKGRVERVNQTLQDRLVKEMRLLGISSIKAGNHYLPKFIQWFNDTYAKQPKLPTNVHRPLTTQENLNEIFTKRETRILSKNLTCQYQHILYQIQTKRPSYALRKATVEIREDMQGTITIWYKGKQLDYTIFQQQPKASITDIKHVNQQVDQLRKNVSMPFHPEKARNVPPSHPWKNFSIQQKQHAANYKKRTFLLCEKPDISTLG